MESALGVVVRAEAGKLWEIRQEMLVGPAVCGGTGRNYQCAPETIRVGSTEKAKHYCCPRGDRLALC